MSEVLIMATKAKFLTVKKTAETLGVSPNTVRSWGASGKLCQRNVVRFVLAKAQCRDVAHDRLVFTFEDENRTRLIAFETGVVVLPG